PDIQTRVIPLFFGERSDPTRKDDTALMEEINRSRDGLLSWAARQAQELLKPNMSGTAKPVRFQKFAALVNELDPFTGAEALTLAYSAARLGIAELDPLVAAILRHGKPIT